MGIVFFYTNNVHADKGTATFLSGLGKKVLLSALPQKVNMFTSGVGLSVVVVLWSSFVFCAADSMLCAISTAQAKLRTSSTSNFLHMASLRRPQTNLSCWALSRNFQNSQRTVKLRSSAIVFYCMTACHTQFDGSVRGQYFTVLPACYCPFL